MSNRLKIAIDIDDVLADHAKGFTEFSNAMWGTNLRPEDYDEHWAEIWQVDNEETEKRATLIGKSGLVCRLDKDDEALGVLRELSVHHELVIVTSRRLQMRQDTLAWIHEHYPGIFTEDTIYFAGMWDTIDDTSVHKTKADVVTSIGADYLIDDQLKHCLAVAQSGGKALLFGNYSWNQIDELPEGISRVNGWRGAAAFFAENRD